MEKHQPKTMVVRVHPHAWRWRVGASAGALVIVTLGGYLFGVSSSSDIPFFDSPEERLLDQVAQLTVERDIDRQTLLNLRETLSDQTVELSEMREMLSLYRGVMLPDETDDIVVLRAPMAKYDATNNSLQLVSLVHRGAGEDRQYRGNLKVSIEGSLAGKPHIINAAALDSGGDSSVFPLSFRYLQKVQVAFSLPKSFLPSSVVSSVTLYEPRSLTLERRDSMSHYKSRVMVRLEPESSASNKKAQ